MRVAIYARVSTQRQAQAQTIEQQVERLQAYVEQQGWALGEDHIFRDDGYSGAELNRPVGPTPGSSRSRGTRSRDSDRTRSVGSQLCAPNVLLEELEGQGCQVEFLDRPMSQDPHDQLLLQIRGAVAEYERTLIAERMRRGRQARYRAGVLLPWTKAPYGYQVHPDRPRDPSGVQMNPVDSVVVREMFSFYLLEDTSLYGLVTHLHEMGISSPQGGVYWNVASVRGVLTNPVYTGVVYAGRIRTGKPRQRYSAMQPMGKQGYSRAAVPPEDWIPIANIPASSARGI